MSDLKKDLEQIEAYLAQPSPLGKFARQEEPTYKVLRSEVEFTGKILAKAEHVVAMRKIAHMLATAELQAFINGEELPKKKVEAIKESINVFITELKEGKWS